MSSLGYIISGAGPLVRKFKVGASPDFTVAGAPAINAVTTDAGVVPTAAATATIYVGLSLDTSKYSTAQAGPEGVISLVINPDAVYRSRISGNTTAGTALTKTTNSAASSGGTAVTITTGDPAPNSPTMLDGTAICITGANAGLRRKITTVSATVATLLVPFPNAIAVGDTFVLLPFFPGAAVYSGGGVSTSFTTTPGTLATEVRQDVGTGGRGVALAPLEILCDTADPARVLAETYLFSLPYLHYLNPNNV